MSVFQSSGLENHYTNTLTQITKSWMTKRATKQGYVENLLEKLSAINS
ncbi:hypothetical protein JYT97_02335 [Haliea sp. AH-315-K21]|nr:hypothetical protein [Haliea sp. AH-315-K21]MBN4076070.1 hypothetical protein [Gammaproteobacteria bacterium AH-315-E17]